MIEPCRHAIFIEPEDSLRDAARDWKARVAARWPAARYVTHPPHSTVWVGDMADPAAAADALRAVAPTLTKFRTSPPRPHVFYDDALTGGGQTCVFAVSLSDDLARLQRAVCEAIRPHVNCAADARLPVALRREPFMRSWQRYGYPFVGPHWIPHVTIASVPAAADDRFLVEFCGVTPGPRQLVQAVGWWRVTGDRHERLASMWLGARIREAMR